MSSHQFDWYAHVLRPILFQLPPEWVHHAALKALQYLPSSCFHPPVMHVKQPIHAMGLTFPHAIGLAAGLDKNGAYLKGLSKLNLAFIEVGTVTPKPQVGNPKPRLFRLPQAHALINRMGFNNHGVHALVNNIRQAKYAGILGINIGKNKQTSLSEAAEDYLYCMDAVYPYASYITVNISSPNTPDLRQLQQGDYFVDLMARLTLRQKQLEEIHHRQVPLVIKLSPDETPETLKRMAAVLLQYKVAGIIATNTTASREGVIGLKHAEEQGGLSGAPLRSKALACLTLLKQEVGDAMTLIGSGGIDSQAAVQERLQAGADLVQVYTGLIYQGPFYASSSRCR